MVIPWNGRERRKTIDHDTIVELTQIMRNHISNFDIHREDFNKHTEDDKVAYKEIKDLLGKHAIFIYIGIGIITTLQFLLKH